MFRRWFQRKDHTNMSNLQSPPVQPGGEDEHALPMTLSGRSIRRSVQPVVGSTILQLAEKHKVDWSSNCRRGTCGRCRSKVLEGMEFLSSPNEAEIARLESEELEAGFRLGCQATVVQEGKISVKHAPYF